MFYEEDWLDFNLIKVLINGFGCILCCEVEVIKMIIFEVKDFIVEVDIDGFVNNVVCVFQFLFIVEREYLFIDDEEFVFQGGRVFIF